MKRYFFHLSGSGWEPDRVGTELASDNAAELIGIEYAGEVIKSEPQRLKRGRMRLDVHDEARDFGFAIEISMVVGFRLAPT